MMCTNPAFRGRLFLFFVSSCGTAVFRVCEVPACSAPQTYTVPVGFSGTEAFLNRVSWLKGDVFFSFFYRGDR